MNIIVICPCGTGFEAAYKDRKKVKYCSKECRMNYRNGVGNPSFNATVSIATAEKRGDVLRGRGENKTYTKEAGKHQHITVMERELGRSLFQGEVVHHRDGNIHNNDITNLQLLRSQSEHMKKHFWE